MGTRLIEGDVMRYVNVTTILLCVNDHGKSFFFFKKKKDVKRGFLLLTYFCKDGRAGEVEVLKAWEKAK